MKEEIYFLESEHNIFIQAVGHITAHLCLDLRQTVNRLIHNRQDLEHIYLDLSQCTYMDSTFMGLIVGFNKRFLNAKDRKLTILHPSDTAVKLLKGLGIWALLEQSDEDILFPEHMTKIQKERPITPQFLLHSHENLARLSASNEKKFAMINKLLSKEIRKK